MSVKINGKPFQWDETEIYAGEPLKSDRKNLIAWSIIIGGIILCIVWWNGGYLFGMDSFFGWWRSA